MPARLAFTVWGGWLGALGLATALTALGAWNSRTILPLGLLILMFAAGLGLVVAATARLVRGPRRDRALAALLLGTAPFWFLTGHILMAFRPALNRHVPPGWPSKVLLPLARPLVDLQARWLYPQRTAGTWVTMVAAATQDARAQVAAMDRHVDALLARLGQSETWPIVWYRGPLSGLKECAIYDVAFGSETDRRRLGADGLTEVDRHEVAHCVITRNYTTRSDPPRILLEGWAQANQGTPVETLASTAWDDHEAGRSRALRELVTPEWYWYSGTEAYNQGAPLVNYLLRVYGPERFLKLYTTCGQATFEADCRAALGIGLDELDAAYWADIERIARSSGPPARVWLKSLKLAPGVDPAAWDAFLNDYFAAAARLVALYDQVRMTTTFRIDDDYEEQLTLVRSGPFARVLKRASGGESAILANPVHSLRAFRELLPETGPWRIHDDAGAAPARAHRQALARVESMSGDNHFAATHGGAILLEYPRNLRAFGFSTDFEVAALDDETRDGHRLVTLRLRSSPWVEGPDRADFTFEFDAADSFIVRSARTEGYEARFEYGHEEGRPILRSSEGGPTSPDPTTPARSTRLEVAECRFGPIPESEFDPESFLGRLAAEAIIRDQPEGPSTATSLDWYWLAFVGGGISLAGGAGLSLGGRRRDRPTPRTG